MSNQKQIVFLIGAARSGTTLLGEQLLSNFPEINYIGEKNWIWKYGNVYKHTDQLSLSMLSEDEKEYIIDRFTFFHNKKDKPILIEKTPSNTLRLPLLMRLFPEAKFIFLFRNGEEVARSAFQEWVGLSPKALDSKKIRNATPAKRSMLLFKQESDLQDRAYNFKELTELPYYFYRFLRNFLKINMKAKSFSWGPMNKEINAFRKQNELLLSCAFQWKVCTEKMLEAVDNISEENRLLLHFDDIKKNPKEVLNKIALFLSLTPNDELVELLAQKVKGNTKQRKKIDPDVHDMVAPVNALVGEILEEH